ncbi:type IV pilin N-terminal domain-containing protein [Haloarcula montana]|uniref:type IV pilin N-terminal domain-containing protein n=1 Tax=Haloarcula montana TaxID=3111776 RepID=UPI002D798570|nr:type IV pilin N-terminal domain-containing protein [Haloarcula sp. GH36]
MRDDAGNERGVSTVIGVVLMVAIVVILAAVVGTFVLNIGQQQPQNAPQTAIVADYSKETSPNGEYLNLSVGSGETLQRNELSVTVSDVKDSSGNDVSLTGNPIQTQAPTEISSGTEISINAKQFSGVGSGEHLDLSEATLRIVWEPATSEETNTYVIYRWPDPSTR